MFTSRRDDLGLILRLALPQSDARSGARLHLPYHPIFAVFNQPHRQQVVLVQAFMCFFKMHDEVSFAAPAEFSVAAFEQDLGRFADELPCESPAQFRIQRL